MRLLVSDLAALMCSDATLLLGDAAPAPDLALPLWRAVPLGEDWLLRPEGSQAGAGLALAAAPAGVLGVLSASPPPWLAAWPAEPPPVFADVAALAAVLAAMMLHGRRRQAALREALVALRLEHEDSRLAIARWMRSAGQGWPQPPRLVHAETPADGPPLRQGRSRLRRVLPAEVGEVAALALHLAEADCGPGSALRLRLLGEESRIVLGAWLVPGEALRRGWLALDLPMPVAPRRETAVVEIDVDLAQGDVLALGDSPALRLNKTEGMGRFTQAAYWDGLALGLSLPPGGVWLGLPAHLWAGVPRRLVLAPGETREVRLPAVPVLGLDRLMARLRLLGGAAMQAALHGPETATGWRDFAPDGTLEMALPLPVTAPAVMPLTLTLRQLGPAACGVEWQALAGMRAA
ncbi:MAG: hypothetical protein H7345_09655 [Rubritepida sp.]|nr:hypothetical protein [Rubritepida sp.]